MQVLLHKLAKLKFGRFTEQKDWEFGTRIWNRKLDRTTNITAAAVKELSDFPFYIQHHAHLHGSRSSEFHKIYVQISTHWTAPEFTLKLGPICSELVFRRNQSESKPNLWFRLRFCIPIVLWKKKISSTTPTCVPFRAFCQVARARLGL